MKMLNHTGVTLLSQLTSRIQQTTNCSCLAEDAEFGSCNKLYTQGYTISVAVMRSLKMNASKMDEQSRLEAIRNFADSLRRRLNRGQCDDDALIAVAIDERAVWTSVGKVTERRLSEDHIMAITAQAESLFSKGLYTDGLRYMLESYEKVLQGGTVAISSTFPWPLPLWVIITAACLGLLLIVLLISIVVLKFCLPRRDHYTLGVRQPQQQR
ncbi:hypothetical protein AB6A40_010297 [Gnathostoma spinigerum]|uniref:TPM domain-containing protein n=1 Tax=Gnathostoma spinigerum TaxID=75299 RepID=A0ABD6EUG1_9BILA